MLEWMTYDPFKLWNIKSAVKKKKKVKFYDLNGKK